jgi:hypothetical protein
MLGSETWVEKLRRWWPVALAVTFVLGSALRLIWVQDIEYKEDEAWTFARTQQVGVTEPFPWLGMPTSTQCSNPGMSLWVFLGLQKLFAAHDPTALARTVQLLNITAIAILIWFSMRSVPAGEREPWLWAAALALVNPLAVLFQRKIWPPSVLPLLTVLLLACWWHRDRRWRALAWGLLGACVGQIHMAGFFFAAALVAWTLLFSRQRVAWGSWFVGSSLGAIPLIPWFWYFMTGRGGQSINHIRLYHILECKFWMRWFTEPFGHTLRYALGNDFKDFLRYPLWHGRATHLVWLLHMLIYAIAGVVLVRAAWEFWQNRRQWAAWWAGKESSSALLQSAALWGFGILLTFCCLPIHRHYLIVAFPLGFLWLAQLVLARPQGARLSRSCLLILCVAQFSLSASFLGYVHHNQRIIRGDYGCPYGSQRKLVSSLPAGAALPSGVLIRARLGLKKGG